MKPFNDADTPQFGTQILEPTVSVRLRDLADSEFFTSSLFGSSKEEFYQNLEESFGLIRGNIYPAVKLIFLGDYFDYVLRVDSKHGLLPVHSKLLEIVSGESI